MYRQKNLSDSLLSNNLILKPFLKPNKDQGDGLNIIFIQPHFESFHKAE